MIDQNNVHVCFAKFKQYRWHVSAHVAWMPISSQLHDAITNLRPGKTHSCQNQHALTRYYTDCTPDAMMVALS